MHTSSKHAQSRQNTGTHVYASGVRAEKKIFMNIFRCLSISIRAKFTDRQTDKSLTVSSFQNRTDRDRSGKVRTGQNRPGQAKTGQDRSRQVRTGQDRTGQERSGQVRTDKDR